MKKLITQVGPDTGDARDRQHESIVKGLTAGAAILGSAGVTVMIEPLNTKVDHPGYYLTSSAEAFGIVRAVGSPNVKVVFDIYHQQISEGNIIPNIRKHSGLIGHFHAADNPGRTEPGTGELNYRKVFKAIEETGYSQYVGLEYRPSKASAETVADVIGLAR